MHHAPFRLPSRVGSTPLLAAAEKGYVEMVKELLAARAPVAWSPSNSREVDRRSALHLKRGCSLLNRVVPGSSSDGQQNCINICKRIIMFTILTGTENSWVSPTPTACFKLCLEDQG